MTQVHVLQPLPPIDFDAARMTTHEAGAVFTARKAVVRDLVAPQSPSTTNESLTAFLSDDEDIYSGLPPLLSGPVDEHIRTGIVAATKAAAIYQPNAERAFFVADLSDIWRQHQKWKRCLPNVEPFYAVKCNPDPHVLRLLAALGTGFDCASLNEINQVLDVDGIDPSRIIFANPCKAASFIRHSAKAGVDMMTFDNADELYKIARLHPRAKLVVRILTDDSKSLCRLGLKFGASLVMVPGLLAKAKELGLDVIGVSFHVGSGSYDPNAFADAITRARAAFDMGAVAGYDFTLLDVGGGFEDAHFEQTAEVLAAAIEKSFPEREGLRIIAEPGRFYVSKAFTLAANIIARRGPTTEEAQVAMFDADDATQPKVMYYINDGVYGSFNCILFDHQIVHPHVLTLNRAWFAPALGTSVPRTALEVSSVWGPTCDSIDCVSTSVLLPRALEVGDWLGFRNMGAYTLCAASQFNGFESSGVIYTVGVGEDAHSVRGVLGLERRGT